MRKIILTLDSANMGGIETHVLTLAKHLQQQGYPVQVWFIRQYRSNPFYALLDENQINYHFCTSLSHFWHKLRQHRKKIILHTHGYKAGIIGRLFAKLLGIGVLSTYHSGDLGQGRLRLYSYLDILTARLAACIAVSDLIKKRLPSNTQMIPNFVSVADEPVKQIEQKNGLQVAFVGRLSQEKGPDRFCQLAQMWHQQSKIDKTDVEFVVYGDGPERRTLQDEFNGEVIFKGHVDMKSNWQAVDVLCISSRYEGLPYVALEAMALGIPVVSFDVGGIGDLISDSSLGWLVEAGNLEQLKKALDNWYGLSIEDKHQLSDNVRDKIRRSYSTAALVPSIERIYQRL